MEAMSTTDPVFRATIEGWLAEHGETSMLIYYSGMAGAKSFEFFTTTASLTVRLDELRRTDLVEVFQQPQLPLRGRVDDAFLEAALAWLPAGAEYMVAGLEKVVKGSRSWFAFDGGESRDELEESLRDEWGNLVACGLWPGSSEETGPSLTAIVPQADETVLRGRY